jgi:NAD(P)-dependent dehydrogenase (short-subunit alcohol dehydrogenase family)
MGLLEDKKIVVTGGSSGIGAATTEAYIREGARVVIMDVNDECAERLTTPAPDRCRFLHCDISDKKQVDGAFEIAGDWLGGLDVLANVGAIITYRKAEDFTVEELDHIFAINSRGTLLTNQAAFRLMRDRGGQIINTGSMSGIRPHPGNAAYSATKGAVMAWTRSVAAEWGAYNIRVNALAPVAQTPMSDVVPEGMSEEEHRQFKATLAQQIPLGYMGDPAEDIAPVMVFLASDASHFITGQVIAVDGGTAMLGS